GRGVSTFPALTPVCLSSIATGAHPDVHRIPHLVWYHREERRIVEYGSSFSAIRAAGTRQALLDAIFNMNEQHLGREAVTVYEALERAGLVAAAVNVTCYRGATRHSPLLPGLARPAFGPKRFFFYNLFESDVTGAPVAVFGRSVGSIDAYAAAVGRWLVTREDGEAVARRAGEELRFAPANGGWRTSGDASLLDQPDALERAWAALANPNAGDVIVSPAPGYEFTDLAGRSHLGGGSHGSLEAGDSEVPILTVGIDGPPPRRIVDLAPLALSHFADAA